MTLCSFRDAAAPAARPRFGAPRLWTTVGNMAFLFATAYAIAVVVFRLPTDWFDNGRAFRIALALHVELAVFFWLMSTLAAQWAMVTAGTPRFASFAAWLGAAGTIITAASPVAGGTPIMADYFPWLNGNTLFAAGFVLFCSGIISAAAASGFATLRGQEPPALKGVGISALPTIAAAAAALTTWLHGGDNLPDLAWAAGHTLLFAHLAALSWELPRLIAPGAPPPNHAGTLLALVGACLVLIPLIAAPGTPAFHAAYTQTMAWLLWPPAAVAVWHAWRQRRASQTPTDKIASRIAVVLLVLGLALGALIEGATTLVTAHYHAAVGAVVITRMATTYRWSAQLAARTVPASAAVRQIATYAIGLLLLAGGLALASIDHAPRKTSATETSHKGPYFRSGMMLSGVGGLFAMAGSIWLVRNLTRRRRSGVPADAPIFAPEMCPEAQDSQTGRTQQPRNRPVVVE